MVPFDIISLIMDMLLEDTINITLRIYEKKEIVMDFAICKMRELLNLYTKNVHFKFNNKIYIQDDGAAMGSPLGPVLATVFMYELETALIPILSSKLFSWRHFVDDSICFAKKRSVKFLLDTLNNLNKKNIKFNKKMKKFRF